MFQDLLVKEALKVAVPALAKALAPYLTAASDALVVGELRTLAGKIQTAKLQEYAGWAVDDLAAAWGV